MLYNQEIKYYNHFLAQLNIFPRFCGFRMFNSIKLKDLDVQDLGKDPLGRENSLNGNRMNMKVTTAYKTGDRQRNRRALKRRPQQNVERKSEKNTNLILI